MSVSATHRWSGAVAARRCALAQPFGRVAVAGAVRRRLLDLIRQLESRGPSC
ncbi:MAG: hypothetical protein ACSLFB_12205 [Acidimicrobiales bacterium]